MKRFLQTLAGALLLTFTVTSSAAVITDLYGDKDSFGLATPVTDGQTFDITQISSSNDDPCTDILLNTAVSSTLTCNSVSISAGVTSYTHTYDLTGLGSILSASLEMFTGGQGQQTSVTIDGNLIDYLTPSLTTFTTVTAQLDVFDLTAFASLLTGANTLQVTTTSPFDGWVLDYSELTIVTADVPEPSVLSLLGLGLLGFGVTRRRKMAA